METSHSRVSLLFCYSLALLACVATNTNSITIKRPREELKNELKSLFNGGGALSDFVFFDLEDLQNYTKTKGLPRNRTELRRKIKFEKRKVSLPENTLYRALRDYRRNKSGKQLITSWAKLLHNALYSDVLNSHIKGALQRAIFSLSTRSERLVERAKNQNARLSSADMLTMLVNSDDFDEGNYEEFRAEEENDDYPEVPSQRELESEYFTDDRRRRSPIQTIDHERMRRAASYSYVGSSTCYDEGADGSTSTTSMLCRTCFSTVDFGSTVMPQYANSIECDDSYSKCLSGDGTCTQKVVYYTFQMLTDVTYNTWNSYDQPLNVSCECECIKDSDTSRYMVGNSNEVLS